MISKLKKLFHARRQKRLTDIQRIFYNSRVNGAIYEGDKLPSYKWQWKRGLK